MLLPSHSPDLKTSRFHGYKIVLGKRKALLILWGVSSSYHRHDTVDLVLPASPSWPVLVFGEKI
jgi:hypothetical protein